MAFRRHDDGGHKPLDCAWAGRDDPAPAQLVHQRSVIVRAFVLAKATGSSQTAFRGHARVHPCGKQLPSLGPGMSGLCAAYELDRAGYSVLVRLFLAGNGKRAEDPGILLVPPP
jgi:hypothetical protein